MSESEEARRKAFEIEAAQVVEAANFVRSLNLTKFEATHVIALSDRFSAILYEGAAMYRRVSGADADRGEFIAQAALALTLKLIELARRFDPKNTPPETGLPATPGDQGGSEHSGDTGGA